MMPNYLMGLGWIAVIGIYIWGNSISDNPKAGKYATLAMVLWALFSAMDLVADIPR